MKKKSSFAKHLIVITVLVTILLFGYIYTLEKVKEQSRIRIGVEEELIGKRDILEEKFVEVQQLSSQERIVKIAIDSLGLTRAIKPFEVINVTKNHAKQIKEIVEKKYE